MATLQQTIMNKYGVSSKDAYKKQKEIYEALGSPMGPYKGNYDQNVYLLNNQSKWGVGASPTAPAPTPTAPVEPQLSLEEQFAKDYAKYIDANNDVLKDWTWDENGNRVLIENRFNPYYEEMGGRYKTDINNDLDRARIDTGRGIEALEGDRSRFSASSDTKLTQALDKARNGYVNAGAYFSSAKEKGLGDINQADQMNRESYMADYYNRKTGYETGLQRTETDLNESMRRKDYDMNQEKLTKVEQELKNQESMARDKFKLDQGQQAKDNFWKANPQYSDYKYKYYF